MECAEDVAGELVYKKAKDSRVPSAHIFIANCGGKTGAKAEQLQAIGSQFGTVINVKVVPNLPCSYITFKSVDEAKAAKEALNGKTHDELGGKRLHVEYAAVKKFDSVPIDVVTTKDVTVSGLRLIEDFITEEEETSILVELYKNTWQEQPRRRNQHYGFKLDENTHKLTPVSGLPDIFSPLLPRIRDELSNSADPADSFRIADQLTVTEYAVGKGVLPHLDPHSAFEDGIAILSLGSSSTLLLTHTSPEATLRKLVFLPRRSLVLLVREARYVWLRGVPYCKHDKVGGKLIPRTDKLVTCTFRVARQGECGCPFVGVCDSQKKKKTNKGRAEEGKTSEEVQVEDPKSVERKHVIDVYNSIAPHWHKTRYAAWPKIEATLKGLAPYSWIADIGCGNGRNMEVTRKVSAEKSYYTVGCDVSENLVQIAKELGHEVMIADNLKLPYRSGLFDFVLSCAVIQHFATEERRLTALKELIRLLKVGGKVLVSVWALEQGSSSRRQFTKQDVMVPWKLPTAYQNSTDETKGEDDVPKDGKGMKVYQRFIHVFTEGELDNMFNALPGMVILDSYWDCSNWCVLAERRE